MAESAGNVGDLALKTRFLRSTITGKATPMNQRCACSIVAAIVVTTLFFAAPVRSGKKNIIRPLDLVQLDQMIKTSQNRCLIAVMAAWCAPCVKELPDLNKIYNKYKGQGLQLIGITVDFEGPVTMQPIIDRLGIDFPIYWMGEKVIEEYNIRGLPLLLFVQDGKIAKNRIIGLRTRKFLDKSIREYTRNGKLPDVS